MPSTYSTNLKLTLMATGENNGTWGDETNNNLGTLIEQAIVGRATVGMADTNQTVTILDGVTSTGRCYLIECTGSLSANRDLTVPTINKNYIIYNNTTGGFSITVKTAAGTGISVGMGLKRLLIVDGTNVVEAINSVGNLTVAGNLAISGAVSVDDLTVADDLIVGDDTSIGGDLGVSGSIFVSGGVNKVTISAPPTGATLTLADNKTLTVSNSLTLAGTDATVMTFPGASGTVVTLDAVQTLTNKTLTSPTLTGPAVTTSPLTMTAVAVNEAKGSNIASASTTNIGVATGNFVHITGAVTINAFDTIQAGTERVLIFDGALTLTHSAALLLPNNGNNILTAANDRAYMRSEGAGNWVCTSYQRADGSSLSGVVQVVSSQNGTYATSAATIPVDNTKPQSSEGTQFLSVTITPKSATSKLAVAVTLIVAANNNDVAAVALFRDSGTDAISAVPTNIGGFPIAVTFRFETTSGSTAATTFKVRAGCNTHSIGINGLNAFGAVMDGLCASSISVTEIGG